MYIVGTTEFFNFKLQHNTKRHNRSLFIHRKREPEAISDFVSHFTKITHASQKNKILVPFKTPEVGTGKCTRTARGL